MKFYVYILLSVKFNKFYIGQSNNTEKRLSRHNAGKVTSTKSYLPWELQLTIEKNTRAEAMALEKKLKILSKERLIKFIQKYS